MEIHTISPSRLARLGVDEPFEAMIEVEAGYILSLPRILKRHTATVFSGKLTITQNYRVSTLSMHSQRHMPQYLAKQFQK